MLELAEQTQPGPFAKRTIEFGGYIGVRDSGRLVAMAGERMRPAGFAEVSAVCTDPAARGRGLAASLVAEVCRQIRARGETPFLHVMVDSATETTARGVYERLGFRVRRSFDTIVLVRT
jgi:predicted GNAT family acetyltransferase